MTKKHFEAIAAVIKESVDSLSRASQATPEYDDGWIAMYHLVTQRLCNVFEGFNPSFDRDRFLRSCRGE